MVVQQSQQLPNYIILTFFCQNVVVCTDMPWVYETENQLVIWSAWNKELSDTGSVNWTHAAPGLYISWGHQNTTTQTCCCFSQVMISASCGRSPHPLFFLQHHKWPITPGVTLGELFSFSWVLVRPHCPLTDYFWFAHFTTSPAISDWQLDCSDKMALWRLSTGNITMRNTGMYWSRWVQPSDCKVGRAVSREITIQDWGRDSPPKIAFCTETFMIFSILCPPTDCHWF